MAAGPQDGVLRFAEPSDRSTIATSGEEASRMRTTADSDEPMVLAPGSSCTALIPQKARGGALSVG